MPRNVQMNPNVSHKKQYYILCFCCCGAFSLPLELLFLLRYFDLFLYSKTIVRYITAYSSHRLPSLHGSFTTHASTLLNINNKRHFLSSIKSCCRRCMLNWFLLPIPKCWNFSLICTRHILTRSLTNTRTHNRTHSKPFVNISNFNSFDWQSSVLEKTIKI